MLKQKKKLNLKVYSRYRNLFKNNKTVVSPTLLLSKQNYPKYGFILKVTQNNVFCTLTNYQNKKILLNTSSGKEKLNISRKTLSFGAKHILISFLRKIKKKITGCNLIISITAPLRIKVLFLRLLKSYVRKTFIFINTNHKKCFNGCKPPKKKRKKQRGLRVFK
jgi:ribosomal protein S11